MTVIIHPRKEEDDRELQTASIFGTAKVNASYPNLVLYTVY